jgi:hypothetical protein
MKFLSKVHSDFYVPWSEWSEPLTVGLSERTLAMLTT